MRRGLAVVAGVAGAGVLVGGAPLRADQARGWAGVAVAGLLIGGAQLWQNQARAKVTAAAELPEVKAILTSAPTVPPPVDRPGNAKVIVSLEITEVKGTLADGV